MRLAVYPRVVASLAVLMLVACWRNYGYRFAGGGLPSSIKTVAVMPFTNETAAAELQREILDALREALRKRLGLRDAPENRATAIVRGVIKRYEVDIPEAVSANQARATTARRKLRITVDIEMIDSTNKTLFMGKGMAVDGLYAEGDEESGRKEALEKLVSSLIDGVQRHW